MMRTCSDNSYFTNSSNSQGSNVKIIKTNNWQ